MLSLLLVYFQRMYYHPPTEQCFELYHQGPCPEGHILSFNYGNLVPECKCKEGYYLHSDGKCYKLNTQGNIGALYLSFFRLICRNNFSSQGNVLLCN